MKSITNRPPTYAQTTAYRRHVRTRDRRLPPPPDVDPPLLTRWYGLGGIVGPYPEAPSSLSRQSSTSFSSGAGAARAWRMTSAAFCRASWTVKAHSGGTASGGDFGLEAEGPGFGQATAVVVLDPQHQTTRPCERVHASTFTLTHAYVRTPARTRAHAPSAAAAAVSGRLLLRGGRRPRPASDRADRSMVDPKPGRGGRDRHAKVRRPAPLSNRVLLL